MDKWSLQRYTEAPKSKELKLYKDLNTYQVYGSVMTHLYRSNFLRVVHQSRYEAPIHYHKLHDFWKGYKSAVKQIHGIKPEMLLQLVQPEIYINQSRRPVFNQLFAACETAFLIAEAMNSSLQGHQIQGMFGEAVNIFNKGRQMYFSMFEVPQSDEDYYNFVPQAFAALANTSYGERGILTSRLATLPDYETFTTSCGTVYTDSVTFANMHMETRESSVLQ